MYTQYQTVGPSLEKIINLAHLMRGSADPIVKNLSTTLSTRQLLRLAHRMSVYSPESQRNTSNAVLNSAYETVQRTFLAKFLPSLPRAALENAIRNVKIQPIDENSAHTDTQVKIANGQLSIGSTTTPLYETDALTKVPDIQFFDVPQHIRLLEHLLQVSLERYIYLFYL